MAKLDINRRLQSVIAFCGGAILFLYWQSWKDLAHIIYDIPSGIIMCAFIGQIICEGLRHHISPRWWIKIIILIPMSVIPTGREFFSWPISGHLTDMLAVALIQTADERLWKWERVVYWIPLPIILAIRWFIFDKNGHYETYYALILGLVIFLSYYVPAMLLKRKAD